MLESYIELRKDEWDDLNVRRVVIERPNSTRKLVNRRVSFPLQLITHLNRNSNISVADIEFTDCIFVSPVEIGDYLCAGNLFFKNCKFESDVTVESMGNVKFEENCRFEDGLSITRLLGNETIADVSVAGALRITGNNGGKVIIQNVNGGTSKGKQSLTLLAKCQSIEIRDCTFKTIQFVGTSRIQNVIVSKSNVGKIDLFSVEIGSQFSVFNCQLESFVLHSADEIEGYLFLRDNNVTEEVVITMPSFKFISIEKNRIKKLELVDFNKKDFILDVTDLQAEEVMFNSIFNDGKLSLKQVSIKDNGRLTIHSSNLGKADFLLCDFENAILDFDNSKVTEIFLAETEFPKVVESNGLMSHRQAQLAFGQISTAFNKQGDTVRALEYQAREIEAHYKQLKIYDKKSRKISFTKISLWLNKWSNDFGRNWQRGVLFSILAGLLFFYLVVISSNEYSFGFRVVYDPRVIPSYFRFMNPLRFFELESIFKIGQEKPFLTLCGWSYFFDLLGRVFVAYGFYQTIQAFRKYGRK